MFVKLIFFFFFHSVQCFPFTRDERLSVCKNGLCLKGEIEGTKKQNGMIVAMATYNLAVDPYPPLYVGWLLELFPENTKIIIADASALEFWSFSRLFLTLLPVNSIFISFNDGEFIYSLPDINAFKANGTVANFGVFHINNEMPWTPRYNMKETEVDAQNHIVQSYAGHPIVFRNYYYAPLLASSVFLPLGPSNYGWHLPLKPPHSSPLKPSQRHSICTFHGRFIYDIQVGTDALTDTQQEYVISHPEEYDLRHNFVQRGGVAQRDELISYLRSLSNSDTSSFPCDVSTDKIPYETYIELMFDNIFTLCPGGNNLETFRHYEAFEAGSIPIIMATEDHDRNFLLEWDVPLPDGGMLSYPGPVLSSWHHVHVYLNSFSLDTLDNLQMEIRTWYTAYKQHTQLRIVQSLQKAFPGVSIASAKTEAEARPVDFTSHKDSKPDATAVDIGSSTPSTEESIASLSESVRLIAADIVVIADYANKLNEQLVGLQDRINVLESSR